MTRRTLHTFLVAFAVAALAACSNDGDGGGGGEHAHDEGSHKVRQLNAEELDTLRHWKSELEITRDEYWDDRGGVLANSWAEVWYPRGNLTVSHGMYALKRIDRARRQTLALFGAAPDARLTIVCSESLESYKKDADREWWQYSRVDDKRIVFQPMVVLAKRGLAEIATEREYYRWAMRRLSDKKVPRWLEYGLASLLAEEGQILTDNLVEFPDDPILRSIKDADRALKKNEVKKDVRIANYNAWKTADRLAAQHGRQALARMIAELGTGASLDDASRRHLGEPWDDAVSSALAWQTDWKR